MARIGSHWPGLWRKPPFLLFWAGQTISQIGSQVSVWALPLTAALTLHATPVQMGLLTAAGTAPRLLFGLPAGVWVDRFRRRPIMIAADLGRALLLGAIPLAYWLGLLGWVQFILVAFTAGVLGIFFDASYAAFLPILVEPDQILEGNSKLEGSAAAAQIAGPGMAGGLVQWVSGPVAILADAVSFLISAITLTLLKSPEPRPARPAGQPRLRQEIGEGLALIWRQPVLRALATTSAIFNLFDSALSAVYVLYLTHTLGIGPALVGLTFVLSGTGGVLGALLPGRIIRGFGVGPALLGGVLAASIGEFVISVAGGPPPTAMLVVVLGEGALQCGVVVYGITSASLRQTIVPNRLLGRVTATGKMITGGAIPLGAIIGGIVGDRFGLRPTVLISGIGTSVAFLWLLASPVRDLRDRVLETIG